ncbi:MAG: hypothetical protein K6G87_15015 [Butyrivibrio sp.]|uniref:hypothetical protein n=1 Tax=Butyrivibrio sp. TaxID=28121 RepID=UPI0025E6C344|nr:hypothetical protein [Butyrivibrio sp.]MCR5772529.1 hypothetical protein [Butyrivibrio sp.]
MAALNLDEEQVEKKEVKARKKTKKTRELLEEADRQMEQLHRQHDEYEEVLATLNKQSEELGEQDAKGLKVEHAKFGEGKVTAQDGKYIDVKFGKVIKKFVLPGAIAEKHLKVSDEKIQEFYNKSDDIHKQILKVQMQLRSTDFAIERQADNIEKLNQKA